MLKIDSENMVISMTRGDTANIVFSAVDDEGNEYEPQVGDIIRFAVAKKVGAVPLFELQNVQYETYTDTMVYDEAFITQEEYEADPTQFYTESGGVYTQCLITDPYDGDTQYYTGRYALDTEDFWTITIQPANTNPMKFGDYVFDVQLTHGDEVDTIIGKTDELNPTFRLWGEVATE